MKYTASEQPWWLLNVVEETPVDSFLVSALAIVAVAVVLFVEATLVRVVVGLPLLLFLPGYALLTVLFPGRHPSSEGFVGTDGSLTDTVRFALSFGMSVAMLPVIALALWAAWSTIDPGRVALVYGAGTVFGMAAGTVRRMRVPKPVRYEPPIRQWATGLRSWAGPFDRTAVSSVTLVVAVALTVVVATVAIGVPAESASYTGFTLLTQQDDGSYVAGDYPTQVAPDEEIELVVGLANHEAETVTYTVVVELQRVAVEEQSARVSYAPELTRFEATVGPDTTRRVPHRVVPTIRGEDLRLAYYLYAGDVPADPNAENAYRSLYLWIDVGGTETADAPTT